MSQRLPLRRVVVTGMGVVSPLGCGLHHFWSNLVDCKSGVKRLAEDFEMLPACIGAQVPRGTEEGQFDKSKYKSRAQNVNFIAYALHAAQEALNDAKWCPTDERDQNITGVAVGSGIGSLTDTVQAAAKMEQPRGFRKISPFYVPRILVNLAGGHISIDHQLKGPNHCCATACATGAHAIGDAFRIIERGDAEVMVCGGTESCIDPLSVAGFARAQVFTYDL